MINPQILAGLRRLAFSSNVQTRRTLYPFYLKYMAVAGEGKISGAEKVAVYFAFMAGILGPPTFIMYDVGHKRPDNKK